MLITVERKSKFGVQHNGAWYNIGRGASVSLDFFREGMTYDIDTVTNGKYINIMNARVVSSANANSNSGGSGSVAPSGVSGGPSAGNGLTAKDKNIVRQTVVKAVLHSPVFAHTSVGKEDSAILASAETWCERFEAWVNRG